MKCLVTKLYTEGRAKVLQFLLHNPSYGQFCS